MVAGAFDGAQLRDRLEAAFGEVDRLARARSRRCQRSGRPRPPALHRRSAGRAPEHRAPGGAGDRPPLARSPGPGRCLNAILGGTFTSRLNFTLREKKGYTYGAASSFAFLRSRGSFAARAAVFAESTAPAVREMLGELRGLHERPITTEEHAKARATLLMRVAEGLATTGGIASTFGEIGLYGLPLDEPLRFVAALEQTTADHLRELATRYVDPDGVSIFIVGDRAAIEPGLLELGLPAAVLRNAEGEPV